MSWKEPDAYDDWDAICQAIYRSIVIGSIAHSDEAGGAMPLPDYDRRLSCYDSNSFIGDATSQGQMAFVCFETETFPFDRCLFDVLDRTFNVVSQRRVPTVGARFCLYRRRDGEATLKSLTDMAVSL